MTYTDPSKWLILNRKLRWEIDSISMTVYTNNPCILWCLITDQPPTERRVEKLQRGVPVFCYILRKLIGTREIRQYEYAETTEHHFFIPDVQKYKTYWYRFRGLVHATKSKSSSPIFKTSLGWYWEPWDGPWINSNHDWAPIISPNYFAQPRDGWLVWQVPWRLVSYGGNITTPTWISYGGPGNPLLPHYLTHNTIRIKNAWHIDQRIRLMIHYPGGDMDIWYVNQTMVPRPFPDIRTWEIYVWNGWGCHQNDVHAALELWCNHNGKPYNPTNARLFGVGLLFYGQNNPEGQDIELQQDYLDLTNDLIRNMPLTPPAV